MRTKGRRKTASLRCNAASRSTDNNDSTTRVSVVKRFPLWPLASTSRRYAMNKRTIRILDELT